jgi:peroxiredoxin Q/BCP
MRVLPRATVSILLAATLAIAGSAAGGLKVGDAAPPFSLQGSDGKRYNLADYKGKQAVVVAWFAKAFSSP